MASTSIRNLVSHVASILYANFRAVPENWQTPKLLPKGCHSLLQLILTTAGSHVKTILRDFFLNEDYISLYCFTGTAKNDNHNNIWSRVKEELILNRNKDYIWRDDDTDVGGMQGD